MTSKQSMGQNPLGAFDSMGVGSLPMGGGSLPLGRGLLPYPLPFKGKGELVVFQTHLLAQVRDIFEEFEKHLALADQVITDSKKLGARIYLRSSKRNNKSSALPAVSVRWIYAMRYREEGQYWVSQDELPGLLKSLGETGKTLHSNAIALTISLSMLKSAYDAAFQYLNNLQTVVDVVTD